MAGQTGQARPAEAGQTTLLTKACHSCYTDTNNTDHVTTEEIITLIRSKLPPPKDHPETMSTDYLKAYQQGKDSGRQWALVELLEELTQP